MHWIDMIRWDMVQHMHNVMIKATTFVIASYNNLIYFSNCVMK